MQMLLGKINRYLEEKSQIEDDTGSAYSPIYLILVIFSSIVVIQKYRSYHGLLLIDKKAMLCF